MKTPILYVLTSSENDLYLEELWVSLFSLHYFNKEVTVKVLSDESTAKRIKARPELCAMIDDLYPVDVPQDYPAKERSRFIKTNIRNLVEGDFLFIDTDTVICAPLDEVDNLIKTSKEKFGTIHLDNVKGNFEFKNVKFGYNEDNIILKDINFIVNSRETVGFVGKSGAGKSTIFSLLCKMYDVNDGVITIDGVNINELDKSSIRDNITIINQNPYIFNLSIRDNLKLNI